MKRFLSLALMLLIMVSLCLPGFANTSIPSSWANSYVTAVKTNPMIDVSSLMGSYQNQISRGEFAYLAVNLFQCYTEKVPEVGSVTFVDTNDRYVLAAKNAGIVSGYTDGTYLPNKQIRRDELATLFVNLFKASGVKYLTTSSTKFADDSMIASWAKESVYIARTNGIVNGVGSNNFNPTGTATREEALIMLYKAMMLIEGNESLEVHFIDVGQGDSALIKKGNKYMLIDGGTNNSDELLVNYLKNLGVTKLEYIIATHPHEDHIGGLDSVVRAFEVTNVILPNATNTTLSFENFIDELTRKNVNAIMPIYGNTYDLNGASFIVLAPNSSSYENLNDYSVVVKLINGANSFLFAGDATTLSESEMLQKNSGILKSDVLKVGHHGSGSSSSQSFLNAVLPKYAVISVGSYNEYGHPTQTILNRLIQLKSSIFRTDLLGTILAKSDGINISFNKVPLATSIITPIPTTPPITPVPTIPTSNGIIISNLDKIAEIVTIKNTTPTDVNLKGWTLVSEKGNQRYTFPSYLLKAGTSVTVASGDATGNLKWTTSNMWNNSEPDPAALYDQNNNLIFRLIK